MANIVETAVNAGSFNTLVATVKAADVATDNGIIHIIDTVLLTA